MPPRAILVSLSGRAPALVAIAAMSGLVGCASSLEGAQANERIVVAGETVRSRDSREETTVVLTEPAPQPEGPKARPRLSQTVTLGQGASESVYGSTPAAQASAANGTNVTVNNNITVVQPTPPAVYGGYYGGYGYGGYGGYGGRGTNVRDGSSGTGSASSSGNRGAWAPSGWEGAGRTAAPGQTPGVGGNFAPAPSFGPRPMR